MGLPFFYIKDYNGSQQTLTLDEDTSKHVVQVLRMKEGEALQLTDGKGNLLLATISEANKKHCIVAIESNNYTQPPTKSVLIAISLLKNINRFEWFLEKVTELGVTAIIPLICERTEKEKFREERLQGILISAMLQSQQAWLPVLHNPVSYPLLFRQEEVASTPVKYIAHCLDDSNKQSIKGDNSSSIILIGPEGDFTKHEIELALQNNFIPVTLAETRLRTETAGVVAATLLKQVR